MKKPPTPYAKGTTVSVDKSQFEIKTLLVKHGATSFGLMESPKEHALVCELRGRRLKFSVIPDRNEKERMRQWRVLLLRIKARLEELNENIKIDEAFMPYILLPNGSTVGESVISLIGQAYSSNVVPSLFLTYKE